MPRIVKPAEERRDEIVDCAYELFAEQGYDATSVNQIIARVGISKGAFYHHFAAKEDLLQALACRLARQNLVEARKLLEDPTHDAFWRLTHFLRDARLRKSGDAVRMQAALAPLYRDENRQLFERTHAAIMETLRPMLTRLIAEGVEEQTFDTSDPDLAADTILQLSASMREYVMRAFAADHEAEREHAITELERRIAFVGTVMDRILGLPDGSLDIGPGDVRKIIDQRPPCAAAS